MIFDEDKILDLKLLFIYSKLQKIIIFKIIEFITLLFLLY